MATTSKVAENVDESLVQVNPKIAEINKFLDELPGKIYFMGEQHTVKKRHDLQEIVLKFIIKKYPDKVGEIRNKIRGHFLATHKFYTKERGSKEILKGYWMDIKSPRKRMLKYCETALTIVGIDGLAAFKVVK